MARPLRAIFGPSWLHPQRAGDLIKEELQRTGRDELLPGDRDLVDIEPRELFGPDGVDGSRAVA